VSVGDVRTQKEAVVAEVRDRISSTEAVVLTEYRGLDVPAMAELRKALREAGGDYKVYKNTLVRFAARELELDIEELLVGPTALAFVGERADGTAGDPVSVAKALHEFAKAHEALIVKGGVLDGAPLTADEVEALSKVAPREVLLAQLAGAMAAPLQQFAGLLNALPQNLAYALQALIDEGGAPGAPVDAPAEAAADETEAAADETEAAADEAPAEETDAEAVEASADETEAAADEAPAEETDAEAVEASADETEAAADEAPAEASDEAADPVAADEAAADDSEEE
jgi:large subunit ribosomal protein L10